MSTVLRLLFWGGLLVVAALVILRPRRFRGLSRRVRIVGYAYVAAILISAALRALGVVDWS